MYKDKKERDDEDRFQRNMTLLALLVVVAVFIIMWNL